MKELELLREANPIQVEDLPEPNESPFAQRLLAAILESGEAMRPAPTGARAMLRRHRVALAALAGLAVALVAIAIAVFPGSSETSTGLAKVSNRGIRASFSEPHRSGPPYILAERDGKVFFRVERPPKVDQMFNHLPFGYPCWGVGRLASGKIDVLVLDCTPFPAPGRSVLDYEAMDVSSGTAKFLFIEGFAADGVAEVRLVDRDGALVSEAPVKGNVFSLEGVSGVEADGATLLGIDPKGHEVWHRDL